MIVYRNKRNQTMKWIFALVIFALTLTFTVDNVEGFNLPSGNGGSKDANTKNQPNHSTSVEDDAIINDGTQKSLPSPSSVPEPATLILLASGLGTMYALRRKNSTKID